MQTAVMTREGANTVKIALALNSLTELREFCAVLAGTEMVPKAYKGKKDDVLVSVLHGQEIGLPPLQALQSIAVINGVPSIFGDAALALVRSSGKLEDFDEWIEVDDVRIDKPVDVIQLADVQKKKVVAFCMSKRVGMKPRITWFSVNDAKRARLWLKKGYEGKETPWCHVPQRMLMWRARGWNLRDNFGDVLKGLAIYEEAMDIETTVNGETRTVQVIVEKEVPPAQESKAKGDSILSKVKKPEPTEPTKAPVEEAQVVTPPATDLATVVQELASAPKAEPELSGEDLAKQLAKDKSKALAMSGKGTALLQAIRKDFKLRPDQEIPDHNLSLFIDALDAAFEKLKGGAK